MKRIAPLFVYDDLSEPLAFWRDRFGLPVAFELPDDPSKDPAGQPVGFVMFQTDAFTLMLQSRGSIENDAPETLGPSIAKEGTALYIEVEDLAPYLEKAQGCEMVMEERESFYGMREFGVRAPGGVLVTFAQRIAETTE